jgi:exonuclease III
MINNNAKNPKKIDNLKIMQWNCNGIRNKLENLKLYIKKEKPDIILLNETKCDKEIGNFFLELSGYDTFHNPRKINANSGGGVAILAKKALNSQEISEFSEFDEEICCINIGTHLFPLHFLTYYNPPKAENKEKIISYELFRRLYDKNINFLLGGDLNSKITCIGCKINNSSGLELIKVINDFKIAIANDRSPTYYEEERKYHEILDLFLVSDKVGRYVSDFKVDSDSDLGNDHYHCPVFLTLNLQAVIYEKINTKKLNFGLAKWNDYKSILECEISNSNLNNHNNNNNLSELVLNVTNAINEAAVKCIPLVSEFNFRESFPPNLVKMIKERKNIRKKIKYG